MTDPTTSQNIVTLSSWELQELLANAHHPCPMAAFCDRHGWRRPSMADYGFVDACGKRLALRLKKAVREYRLKQLPLATKAANGNPRRQPA